MADLIEVGGVAVTVWRGDTRSIAVWPGGINEARSVHEAGGRNGEETWIELVADLDEEIIAKVHAGAASVLQADVEGWEAPHLKGAAMDLAGVVAAMFGGSVRA